MLRFATVIEFQLQTELRNLFVVLRMTAAVQNIVYAGVDDERARSYAKSASSIADEISGNFVEFILGIPATPWRVIHIADKRASNSSHMCHW